MTRAELIAKLEAATRPDHELDAHIAIAVRALVSVTGSEVPKWADENFPVWRVMKPGVVEVVHDTGTGGLNWKVPYYTASVDAALTLVPEGWRCGFEMAGIHDPVQCPEAWCWPHESGWEPDWQLGEEGYRSHPDAQRAIGANPAIAICIAALEARPA